MTLHDPLLGDLYSTADTDVAPEEEDAQELVPADDLLDSFTAGVRQTLADARDWGRRPRDAFHAFKHWQPPSAAGHDLYVESVTGDRFEELHQRWIGRGGVRLGVAWIGLVSRGRVFWPVLLICAAVAAVAMLATR